MNGIRSMSWKRLTESSEGRTKMGYDLVSVEPNREASAKFAKKYEYGYLFDEQTGEFNGDDVIYFRANIWGMADIHRTIEAIKREVNQDLDYGMAVPMPIIDKTVYNDGEHVTTADIKDFLDLISAYAGERKEESQDSWLNRVRDNVYPLVLRLIKANRLANPDEYKKTVKTMVDGKIVDREYPEEEAANDSTNLFIEFVDYSATCLELEGFRVY